MTEKDYFKEYNPWCESVKEYARRAKDAFTYSYHYWGMSGYEEFLDIRFRGDLKEFDVVHLPHTKDAKTVFKSESLEDAISFFIENTPPPLH
jgi:hypothetical protein